MFMASRKCRITSTCIFWKQLFLNRKLQLCIYLFTYLPSSLRTFVSTIQVTIRYLGDQLNRGLTKANGCYHMIFIANVSLFQVVNMHPPFKMQPSGTAWVTAYKNKYKVQYRSSVFHHTVSASQCFKPLLYKHTSSKFLSKGNATGSSFTNVHYLSANMASISPHFSLRLETNYLEKN